MAETVLPESAEGAGQDSVELAETVASHPEPVPGHATTQVGGQVGGQAEPTGMAAIGEAGANPDLARAASGQRLDSFVVLEELGRGGMGLVVAAHDPELDRKVAIKILKPATGGTQDARNASERLRREAQAMARLAHPNVITVYQVGTDGSQVYVVMEYVDGGTLRSWAEATPRSWREVLEVYLSAGRGLAAAHHAGLVHRDFKPDNVLIGKDGRVRVTDFGLVGTVGREDPRPRSPQVESSSSSLDRELTRTGEVMGTPVYMAPEQHAAVTTDARADQFAFCVSLYEALYGRRPFGGKTYREIAFEVTCGQPRQPPAEAKVPSWIYTILERGLAKKPDDRYPDLDSLLAALAVDPSRARRRRLLAGGGAGLVACAAAALYLAWPSGDNARARCRRAGQAITQVWGPAQRERLAAAITASGVAAPNALAQRLAGALDRSAAAIAAMRQESCEATQVRGEQSQDLLDRRSRCLDRATSQLGALIERLASGTDPLRFGNAVDAVTGLDRLDRCADLEALSSEVPWPEDPAVRARVVELLERLDQADALLALGRYAEGLTIVKEVLVAAEPIGYPLLLGRARYLDARLRYSQGDLAGAEAALRLAVQRAADARDPYLEVESWLTLVYVVGHLENRPEEGLTLAQAAEAALARVRHDPFYEARMHNNVGLVLLSQGQFEPARERLEQALAGFIAANGEDHLEVAVARNNLAEVLTGLDRYAEARVQLETALAIRLAQLGPDHPDVATTLNDLGLVAHGEGKLDEAERHLTRAVEIRVAALGEHHPRTAAALNNLGFTLADEGKLEQAIATEQRALAILEKLHGANAIELVGPLHNLGNALHEAGQSKPAWQAYARGLAIAEFVYGRDHLQVTELVEDLGSMLQEMGLHDDAAAYFERSLTIRERDLGPHHIKVADTLGKRGWLHVTTGNVEAALADLGRARDIYVAAKPAGDHDRAMAEFNFGMALEAAGALDRAAEQYQQALAEMQSGSGDHPDVVRVLRGLGDVARARGAHQDASDYYQRAVGAAEKAGVGGDSLADVLSELGIDLLDQRRFDEAEPALRRAAELREQSSGDTPVLALNRFLLARAQWEVGDRSAAVALAGQALARFRAAGATDNVAEVEAWLARHR